MPPRAPIHVALDQFGRDAGLHLHRRAWYLRGGEVTAVCDLQKSQYGPSYYLNVGFQLLPADEDTFPKSHTCDISMRGETIVGDDAGLAQLLNLQYPVADEERTTQLYRLLADGVGPYIKRGATIDGLKEMLADGSLPRYLLKANAQRILDPVE